MGEAEEKILTILNKIKEKEETLESDKDNENQKSKYSAKVAGFVATAETTTKKVFGNARDALNKATSKKNYEVVQEKDLYNNYKAEMKVKEKKEQADEEGNSPVDMNN